MRIATWNVERFKHIKRREDILESCRSLGADILVLTETDTRLKPDYEYCFDTPSLAGNTLTVYKPTENRVSVFTDYRCIRSYPTYDAETAVCVELETEKGNLIIYGTIIGILGNRDDSFMADLDAQMNDIRNLCATGKPVCILGDYNLSFADNYYFTEIGRNKVRECFADCSIKILTEARAECIDHIAVSAGFVGDSPVSITEWNRDKVLSDHKGIAVDI